MQLYYFPGACSLAPHILAEEAGIALELVKVDITTGDITTGDIVNGGKFAEVNPKGYVPALRLDDGQLLTEVMVILQYLGDLAPASGLVPVAGSMARYRLQEWLCFIATEVHKGFGPLWAPDIPETIRQGALGRLAKRFAWMDAQLAARPYLLGNEFSAADCYAFTVLNWAAYLKVDLTPYPALLAFMARVDARPAVQRALKAEGLV
ncbi:MAG: glutathione transferase GstA [Bacteroidales bacterium]